MFARTSMECSQDGNFSGESRCSSTLAGAIFMSNCITRRECFQRKIFGLPSSRANFVKNIKTGMILFLFDHGERKLYGVFEATSDGSMNIVPDAYLSLGISYPAQVQFKIIWKCTPLLEKEFRHAIKENYYTPVKFNFDLSYEQVTKLLLLFSTKKIGSPNKSPKIDKNQKKQYEKFNLGKTRVIGQGHYVKSGINEPSRSDHTNIFRYTSMYERNVNPPKYLGNSFTTSKDFMVDTQLRPCQASTLQLEQLKPKSMPLTTQNDSILRESFPISSCYGSREYHVAPCTETGWPSTSLEINYPPLGKKYGSYTRSVLESQDPCLGSQRISSQPDPETKKLPSPDHLTLDVSSNHEIRGGSIPVYEPCRTSSSFSSSKGYNYGQDPYTNSFPECYNPSMPQIFLSTPGVVVTRGMDTSVLDTRNSSEAYQQVESSTQRNWRWINSPAYIPLSDKENLGKNVGASPILISPYKDEFDMKYNYSLGDWDYSDYEGRSTNHFAHANVNCANSAASSLCSDQYQRRTSVFSRLSRSKDDHEQQDQKGEADIYQLLELPSERRKQWNKFTKVHKQEIFHDVDEQSGCLSDMEMRKADWLVEKSIIEAEVDESKIFVNFKRRRKVQNETNEGKHQRRRLIRPSFSDDDQMGQKGQKDVISSDGSGKMHSLEQDVDCCNILLGNIKSEEVKEAAKFHVVGDESSVYPFNGPCEGKLDKAGEENLIVDYISLEQDVDCCNILLGNIKSEEVKEAAKFHVVGDESSVYPFNGLCEGKLDKAGEENLIVYGESLDYISLESNVKDVKEINMIDEAETKERTSLVTSNEGQFCQ